MQNEEIRISFCIHHSSFCIISYAMKITHLITRLIIGGAQENTLLSCEGQHDLGHDVTLLTGPAVGPEGSLMERARTYGYKVVVVDSMRRAISPTLDWHTYRALKGLLAFNKPDIVHTHSSKAGIIGRWAAHSVGCRGIVHTIHGLAFTASTHPGVNHAYKWFERATAPISDKIVCVADSMRDQSLAAHIGRREQYVTVYSGMDTSQFLNPPVDRATVRRELGLADEHIAVGTIARLFDLKGHDDLLDIAPRLCERFPNLRWLWVGDGTLRARFEHRIRQMKLSDRFILTGMVPPAQIPQLAGAMDLLVHPSRREGLARALPQGQLAGKPVITYDIDGAKEGVLDGESGFVLPPFEKFQLADKIALLLGDAELRYRMGEAGRAFALSRFDTKVMVAGLEQVYRSVAMRNDEARNSNE
jgi:glycosyltransferase involved in cell wall biosynthesis